jgi:hypothetical protein
MFNRTDIWLEAVLAVGLSMALLGVALSGNLMSIGLWAV